MLPVMRPRDTFPKLAVILAGLALVLSARSNAGMTSAEVMKYNTTSAYARNGDATAQYNLGICFNSGLGVPKDPVQAVGWWRKSAAQGFAPAMYNLGYSYMNALGVKADLVEGAAWYRKSAELGHVPAMCNLGICYEDGAGVPVDTSEAIRWLGKAAAKGDAAAILRLDLMRSRLSAGKGNSDGTKSKGRQVASPETMQRDLAEFLTRAKGGDSYAQWRLGFIYEQGLGVPVDYVESARWWRMAADQGHPGAEFSIGYCYARGEGVPRDLAEAVRWYRKSSAQGYMAAHRFLGAAYAFGSGVAKDETEAYAYLALLDSSDSYARDLRGRLASKLTPEAVLRAQRRAKELQDEIDARKSSGGTKGGLERLEQSKKAKETELLRKGA